MGKPAARVALALFAGLVVACGKTSPSAPTPQSVATEIGYVSLPDYPAGTSDNVIAMLQSLRLELSSTLINLQANLAANPHIVTWMQQKIAFLQNPALPAEIVNNRRWHETSVASRNGQTRPVVTVFATEDLRGEALQELTLIPTIVSALELFFEEAFPATSVRMWYGFKIGNTGGGGILHMEDRLTYEARRSHDIQPLPYDAILVHEVSHTYIGHETLNQFLELYVYNLIKTGSSDPAFWIETRGWKSAYDSGSELDAVLDIYELIGVDVMARAYQAIRPLRPPFGQDISQAVADAFVSQVPEALKSQVAFKLARLQ